MALGYLKNESATGLSAISDNVSLSNCEIVQVAAGTDHNLALDKDGNLWAWGRNDHGQLGDGTTTNSNVPIQIKKGHKFKTISAGSSASAAIDINGNLWAWGSADSPLKSQASEPTLCDETNKYIDVSVSAGYSFTTLATRASEKKHFGFLSVAFTSEEANNPDLQKYLPGWINDSAPSISNDSRSFSLPSVGPKQRIYYGSVYGSATNYATSLVKKNDFF